MRDLVTGVIGIATVLTFMGILIWWVKAPPLIIISVVVMGLMIYDFYRTVRYGENGTSE